MALSPSITALIPSHPPTPQHSPPCSLALAWYYHSLRRNHAGLCLLGIRCISGVFVARFKNVCTLSFSKMYTSILQALVIPLMSSYAKRANMDPTMMGVLGSAYGTYGKKSALHCYCGTGKTTNNNNKQTEKEKRKTHTHFIWRICNMHTKQAKQAYMHAQKEKSCTLTDRPSSPLHVCVYVCVCLCVCVCVWLRKNSNIVLLFLFDIDIDIVIRRRSINWEPHYGCSQRSERTSLRSDCQLRRDRHCVCAHGCRFPPLSPPPPLSFFLSLSLSSTAFSPSILTFYLLAVFLSPFLSSFYVPLQVFLSLSLSCVELYLSLRA